MWSSSTRCFPKKIPCNMNKSLVTVQRLIQTLLTRIFFDVFLIFNANLTLLLYWYLKFLFLLCFWNLILFPDIRPDKLTTPKYNTKIIVLYLGVVWVCWTALARILALFVPYLLNFCYCCSARFATAYSLVSLLFLCPCW